MREVSCIFFPNGLEPAQLNALAEACMRFSSQVAARPGEAVFIETGGNRWIHEPVALGLRLKRLAERYGPGPRLAVGQHAAEALALARYGMAAVESLPLQALSDYASPFQRDAATEAWLAPMNAALRALGLSQLGDLLRLPAKTVGQRFGADASLLCERVSGQFSMAWPRFEPAVLMQERERFEPVEDFERLTFHLKRLADRMGSRLRGRGLRAAKLDLGIGFERGGRGNIELRLSLPQSAPSALLGILREAFDAKRRQGGLWQAVTSLALSAPELAPGGGSQESFFDSRQREQEQWSALVARLRQRLGDEQVFLAELVQRYLPERAWKKALREPAAFAQGQPVAPLRPSRLLAKPRELSREGEGVLQMPGKRRWHALSWAGPERINGEWWADGFDRDYFRVQTQEGLDLWVYAQAGAPAKEGQLWLHGYFD